MLTLLREAAAELFAEVEELRPAFAVTEPVEHLARREIERGEHLPDTGVTVVRGTQSRWLATKSDRTATRISAPTSSG